MDDATSRDLKYIYQAREHIILAVAHLKMVTPSLRYATGLEAEKEKLDHTSDDLEREARNIAIRASVADAAKEKQDE